MIWKNEFSSLKILAIRSAHPMPHQGCHLPFLKAKSAKFGLFWNYLSEIQWFGHLAIFETANGQIWHFWGDLATLCRATHSHTTTEVWHITWMVHECSANGQNWRIRYAKFRKRTLISSPTFSHNLFDLILSGVFYSDHAFYHIRTPQIKIC